MILIGCRFLLEKTFISGVEMDRTGGWQVLVEGRTVGLMTESDKEMTYFFKGCSVPFCLRLYVSIYCNVYDINTYCLQYLDLLWLRVISI